MSFAEEVKNELCRYEEGNAKSEMVEISSLLRVGSSFVIGAHGSVGLRLSTTNSAVARRALALIKKNFGVNPSVVVRKGLNLRKKNLYTLTMEPSLKTKAVLEGLRLWPMDAVIPKTWLQEWEHKRAFLRGAFLVGGSVNKPQSDYHLEFSTTNEVFAGRLMEVLKSFKLSAKLTERKDMYLIYLKSGDDVTSCLQIMGSSLAMLAFEEVRVMKEVRNQVNRKVNCETANLHKTVEAAIRQVQAIQVIQNTIGLSSLSEKLEDAAKLRLENPDASVQELLEIGGEAITKSGLNHRLKRLVQIAEEMKTP